MNNEKLYITGAGIISAIGNGKEETLASLLAGKTGIGKMRHLSSRHRDIPVGEVSLSNDDMRCLLGIEDSPLLTRTALMGRVALREAVYQARLADKNARITAKSVHFISATTVGGMDRRELFYAQEENCDRTHAFIATHNCASSTEMIAEEVQGFASLATVSTACSSAANAIILGADMIRAGMADIVVAGGAECLSMFHLNGFNTLMILDQQPCRPFDRDRAGLNLGEGAAYVVIEKESTAKKRGVKPLAVVSGYGNACDAFHQTASSPNGTGAVLAMKQALEMARLQPDDIQYINAHGTGTPNNDLSESQAIKQVFGSTPPPVSSTKPFTGHTTSASGAIEAVICLLALQHQFLPQSLNWNTPMENGIIPISVPFNISTPNTQHPTPNITHILSNSFGFGGNDSAIILSIP